MPLDGTEFEYGDTGLTLAGGMRVIVADIDDTDPEAPVYTYWNPTLTAIALFVATTLGSFAGYDFPTMPAAEDGITAASRIVIDFDGSGETVQAATGAQLVEFVAGELTLDDLPFIATELGDYRRTDTEIAQDQITDLPTDLAALAADIAPFTAAAAALPAFYAATDEGEARTALQLGAWATLGFAEGAMATPTDAVKFTVDSLGDGSTPGVLTMAQIRQFVADEMVIDDLPFIALALADYWLKTDDIPQERIDGLVTALAGIDTRLGPVDEAAADILELLALADKDAVKAWLDLGTAAYAATGDFVSSLDLAFGDLTDATEIYASLLTKADPTYDGQIFMPSSSTSAPAIAGAEDTNTGIMLSGDDQLGIVAGGLLRAVFGTWGVNIGGGSFYEPSLARRPTMQVNGLGGDTTEQGVFVGDWAPKSAATKANLRLARVFSGEIGTLTPSDSVTSGTGIGNIEWMSSLGTNLSTVAAIYAAAAGTWSTHTPSRLDFYTAGAAESLAIRSRLDETGLAVYGALSATGAVTGASATLTGAATATRFTGPSYTLPDDTATSFTPPATASLLCITSLTSGISCLVAVRTTATVYCTLVSSNSSNVTANNTDGTLAGTTGTDGQFTVRCNSADGKVYIENRRGASVTFTATALG